MENIFRKAIAPLPIDLPGEDICPFDAEVVDGVSYLQVVPPPWFEVLDDGEDGRTVRLMIISSTSSPRIPISMCCDLPSMSRSVLPATDQ
jgi:hypothetical protein